MNQSDILRTLFRPSLADLIEARGGMTDDDLLAAVFRFAPDHDTLMALTAAVRDGTSDPAVAAWASDILAWQQSQLMDFGTPEPGIVYEVHVKMSLESCDETCLCATYDGALSAIRHMIGEYDDLCPENPDSRYRVVRRRVLSDGEAAVWDGDPDFGEAVFLPGMKLYRLDLYHENEDRRCQERTCDYKCMDCDQEHQRLSVGCRSILFPCGEFTDCCACLYRDPATAESKYVMLWLFDGGPDDLCEYLYAIPLSGETVSQQQFDDDFMAHEHIEPPLLEPVDPSALTPKMRLYYEALAAYVKECEAKKT